MQARTAIPPTRKREGSTTPWLGAILDVLDSRLRLRHGVIEYTHHPYCLFRIELITSSNDVVLSDGVHVRPDDRLISLHVWNEQFPAFPASGPTLAWARRVNRAFDISLRDLAQFLDSRPDLNDVMAICGNLPFESTERSDQLVRFMGRFGFERIAVNDPQPLRPRMHWLGENILISMMVLAHNAAALRTNTLWRDRTPVFLSRQTLRRRYGLVHCGQRSS